METKPKKKFYRKWWFWVVVIVLVIGVAAANGSGGKKDDKPASSNNASDKGNSAEKPESKAKDDKKYSFDKFSKVSMGMTYDQVKAILGDGTEESSSGDGDLKTISYSWKNDDGSNISVMLQGNKVVTKAQALLMTMDAKVTMDKYNKVNNGMTYDQIKGILGEGQLMSQTELDGSKSEIYEWINANGSNMNITFQDGKVDSKTQFELK